jgi:hypothetical protein
MNSRVCFENDDMSKKLFRCYYLEDIISHISFLKQAHDIRSIELISDSKQNSKERIDLKVLSTMQL